MARAPSPSHPRPQLVRPAGGVVPALLGGLAALVARVSWKRLGVLGRALGLLVGSVLRVRRRHVEHAMARAGVAAPAVEARRMYGSLGRAFFELLWMAGRGVEAARPHVLVEGPSARRFAEARRGGRGVVVAGSHTGNWDVTACAMARDVPLLIVTKRLSLGSLDAFWQRIRGAAGVDLVGAAGALGPAAAMLRQGGVVVLVQDQVPAFERHALPVSFLGAPAWADRAPATLALHAGAPLVVVAGRRSGAVHRVEVLAVLEPPRRDAPEAARWVDDATREASARLEAFVRAYPSQWLWMHRRWKRPALRAPRALVMQAPCTIPSSSRAAPSRAVSS